MYGMVWCYEYHARILLMILELWRGFAYTDFLSGGIEGGCIVSDSACRRRCCRWVLFDTGYEKGTHVGAAGPSHHHITNPSLGVVGVSRNSLSNRLLTIGEQSWASSKHGKKNIYMSCTIALPAVPLSTTQGRPAHHSASWRGGSLAIRGPDGWRHTVPLFIPRSCYCSLTCHRSVISQLGGVQYVLGICHPHHRAVYWPTPPTSSD